jgi:hypothetical protein
MEVCEVTSRVYKYAAAMLLVAGIALPAQAQDDRGWTFSGRFSGSSNAAGVVLKADPAVGYVFNRHFQTYAGLPFYFARESSSATVSTTSSTTSNSFMNGIGNAYVGFRLAADNPAVNYSSNIVASAPTGDKTQGFSTGRATVDWTNSFNRKFSSITPFANVGLANTVSDTEFFVRPFTSLGLVTHFDGGAKVSLSEFINVGASAYAVNAVGNQTIVSKVRHQGVASTTANKGNAKSQAFENSSQTVGSADLANDSGFSGWLSVLPQSSVDLQIGYTRSVGYDLNTIFFGVGFRFGK